MPLHEKDDIEGIQGLMAGKLSVDEFRIVSGTKSPRINERNTGRAGKQPLHRLQPGEATHSADLPQPPPRPPLSLLGSVQRHNMVAVIEKLETMSVVSVAGDDNFEGGGSDATVKRPTNQWRLPSKETRRLTIELLESKSTKTIAGAAKMMLVLLHPRLSEDEKAAALPRAALADMKTDQDELTAGEKRLLKSIVKTIVGSRGSSMINAANRALETARKKRDVLEIVQVMVYSCQGAARLPYVSDHSGNTRVKRKARQYVNKKASSRGRDFFGADAGMMLESAAARAANRPAPPSRPPQIDFDASENERYEWFVICAQLA